LSRPLLQSSNDFSLSRGAKVARAFRIGSGCGSVNFAIVTTMMRPSRISIVSPGEPIDNSFVFDGSSGKLQRPRHASVEAFGSKLLAKMRARRLFASAAASMCLQPYDPGWTAEAEHEGGNRLPAKSDRAVESGFRQNDWCCSVESVMMVLP